MKCILLLAVSWEVMCFTHEAGHILGGWATGAKLEQVELRPWLLPYSIFKEENYPLTILWSGPLFGVIGPCLAAAIIRHRLAWFVANFCLLANGLYIAVGWYAGDRFLDTTRMFEYGASPVSVAFYCLVTVVAGYYGFRRSWTEVVWNPIRSPSCE